MESAGMRDCLHRLTRSGSASNAVLAPTPTGQDGTPIRRHPSDPGPLLQEAVS
jgi:hypothetical protein